MHCFQRWKSCLILLLHQLGDQPDTRVLTDLEDNAYAFSDKHWSYRDHHGVYDW